MPGFALLTGMAFEWGGASYRIDRMQPNGDVLLERTDDGYIVPATRNQLLSEYAQGRISACSTLNSSPAVSTLPMYSRPIDELPTCVQSEITRRRHYVFALLDHGDFVFTRAFMQPFIEEVAARIGDTKPPGITTLYRWYSRYRTHQDVRALIPRIDRRGCRDLKQDAEIQRLASEAVQEAFQASPQATGQNIYVRLIAKVEAENRKRVASDRLKRPALRTVYRMLARIDAYDQIALKEGKAIADKRFRIGKAGVKTINILERVEADHTPLDLFLIDETTWLPLGRPTLTVLIDHYSRMLLGYHLSFDSPSTAAVMGALRHAILPKTLAVQVLANVTIEHTWPCYGRPSVLVVDNGLEFHGSDLDSVCLDLDMRLQFCPKHQPQFKGVVESYLGHINYFFAHQLPGTTFARWHQRGDYDPQKHALLTLAEFKHIFEKWVLDVYAQQVHRALGVTPWSKWHEGLTRREPGLPSDLRDLQRRIGLVAERSLRRDGIWLNGIRYSGDELQPIISTYGEGVRVRVVFDPEDLGVIQIWGPRQETPVAVSAVDQDYAQGLTMHQNDLIRARLREQGAATEDRAALERAKLDLAIAVQELMHSRKQRHRRQAAAIQGFSSSKPQPTPAETKPPLAHAKREKRAPQDDATDELPTARYRSFHLKR